jgi:RNA polymerase sigma-70 factor, ECF subfamily
LEDNININSEDNDIIESFIKGNSSAFNLIVLKYQKKIYWVVRKFVLDHDDADDITQEVFLKLFKVLGDFRGDSALYTYIYKMAVNFSLNHIKKNKASSSNRKDIDSEAFKLKSTDINADEKYDSEINSVLIKEAIQSLPVQQRTVFTLRFYEELSYEEIAKITETTVGGLKANYFHAFKKIRTIIKEKAKNN